MKIIKISDKTMFKTNKDGFHNYLIYKEKPSKNIKNDKGFRALQLNHLYNVDKKRLEKLKKGYYIKEKFDIYEVPSLVSKKPYTMTVNKKALDFTSNKYYKNTKALSSEQRIRILKALKIPR